MLNPALEGINRDLLEGLKDELIYISAGKIEEKLATNDPRS